MPSYLLTIVILTHSLTHALTHALTHSLTHALTSSQNHMMAQSTTRGKIGFTSFKDLMVVQHKQATAGEDVPGQLRKIIKMDWMP